MKNLKILGLTFMASLAFTTLSGVPLAHATKLCSDRASQSNLPCPHPLPYNTTFATTMFPGEAVIEVPTGRISCKRSTMPGNLSSNGGYWAYIRNSNLTFSECNMGGSFCSSVWSLEYGSLGIEWVGETQYLNYWGNGTVYGSGQRLQVTCLNYPCVYETAAWTHLGTLPSGWFPKIYINAKLKYIAGNETWCRGSSGTATWRGTYEITSPNPVYVERS